jgi:hypothetical protein
MKVGTRYVVKTGSNDGTFMVGDVIRLEPNGDITCVAALGWVSAKDVSAALAGTEYEVDYEYTAMEMQKALKKAESLKSKELS